LYIGVANTNRLMEPSISKIWTKEVTAILENSGV